MPAGLGRPSRGRSAVPTDGGPRAKVGRGGPGRQRAKWGGERCFPAASLEETEAAGGEAPDPGTMPSLANSGRALQSAARRLLEVPALQPRPSCRPRLPRALGSSRKAWPGLRSESFFTAAPALILPPSRPPTTERNRRPPPGGGSLDVPPGLSRLPPMRGGERLPRASKFPGWRIIQPLCWGCCCCCRLGVAATFV